MDTQDCIVFLSYFVYMHFEFIFCCITAVACIFFIFVFLLAIQAIDLIKLELSRVDTYFLITGTHYACAFYSLFGVVCVLELNSSQLVITSEIC